jgi:hypothetical protein
MDTPRELLRVFPIQKYYEGYKWEVKDYFSSIEYVNEFGLDSWILNLLMIVG